VAQDLPIPDNPQSWATRLVDRTADVEDDIFVGVREWSVPCQTLWNGHGAFETAPKNAYELPT
jgi:hypothetical protein